MCRSELKAIRQGELTLYACYAHISTKNTQTSVFPMAYIQLCQFHIIQAILRWDGNDQPKSRCPRISQEIKYEILILFHALQCCRTWEAWPVARDTFLAQVERLIMVPNDGMTGPASGVDSDADTESSTSEASKKPGRRKRGKLTSTEEVRTQQCAWVCEYFNCNRFTKEWIGEGSKI